MKTMQKYGNIKHEILKLMLRPEIHILSSVYMHM